MIGAGVVGLAIARQLAAREGTSTILLERHGAVGTETSSRNSEVRGFLLLLHLAELKAKAGFLGYSRRNLLSPPIA